MLISIFYHCQLLKISQGKLHRGVGKRRQVGVPEYVSPSESVAFSISIMREKPPGAIKGHIGMGASRQEKRYPSTCKSPHGYAGVHLSNAMFLRSFIKNR